MKNARFLAQIKSNLFLVTACLLMWGCGSKKTVIDRNFAIPENTDMGYMYGKLGHHHKFGTQFKITFKDRTTKSIADLKISIYSGDAGTLHFFSELPPGEYLLQQVIPRTGDPIDIPSLEKDEHREFFVEAGKLTYVGSWMFSEGKLEVTEEKEAADDYMRSNFKYVSTSIALPSLP